MSSSSTFSFGSTFQYPKLRKLWISHQIAQITELLFFIDVAMIEIGNNSLIIYNGAVDYNDSTFEGYLQDIVSSTILFDNSYVIPWRQNVAEVQPYSTVETAFRTLTTKLDSTTIDSPELSDILIIAHYLKRMATFYSDPKTLLMSVNDIQTHLEIYKLIGQSVSNIITKVTSAQQIMIVLSQNDTTHPLYNTLGALKTSLSDSFAKILNVTDYLDKTLINNLENGVNNVIANFEVLSGRLEEASLSFISVHIKVVHIFINKDSTDTIYPFAITNELTTSSP